MISYLMPARDAMGTIEAAVRSVCRMMAPSDQFIIIDDASSDGTSEYVRRLSQNTPNVVSVRNERQGGVALSLNLGLSLASQTFVARIDADDICLPWRRDLDLNQMNHGYDFGFSAAILFGAGMRWPLPQYAPEIRPENLLRVLASGNPFVHSTMIARRQALLDLDGYSSLPAEDYDLWIRAAEAGYRFSRTPVPKILYRVHAGQVTAGKDWGERTVVMPSKDALIKKLGHHDKADGESLLAKIARISRR